MAFVCPNCGVEPANFQAVGSGTIVGVTVFETMTGTEELAVLKTKGYERHDPWECSECHQFTNTHPEELWQDV